MTGGASKYYFGEVASHYENDRKSNAIRRMKWRAEVRALDRVLSMISIGSTLLDAPCGTGRFFANLQDKFRFFGCDISQSMLALIPQRVRPKAAGVVAARIGLLPFKDGQFDYVLCMRFLNLFPPDESFELLRDLCRVARKGVVVQVRFHSRYFDRLLDAYRFVRRAKRRCANLFPERNDRLSESQVDGTLCINVKSFQYLTRREEFESVIASVGFRAVKCVPIICYWDSQELVLLERI